MPFRARFDCLWCGRAHATRTPHDIEGWASLCPDCLARAQDNGFLRSRLRAGLADRARAAPALAAPPTGPAHAPGPAPAPGSPEAPRAPSRPTAPSPAAERDAWYLRQPPFSRGPLIDVPWQMELDQATRWIDGLPVGGLIVELAAGTGWWSPLLAGKGELWIYEEDPGALELARRRLVAHGLVAHLHQRPPTAAPERAVDIVFAAFLLGSSPDGDGWLRRARTVHEWLRPGGTFAFVEAQPVSASGRAPGGVAQPVDGPSGPMWPATAPAIRDALAGVGLDVADITSTPGAFLMGTATRAAT
jgi:hypothetical protein